MQNARTVGSHLHMIVCRMKSIRPKKLGPGNSLKIRPVQKPHKPMVCARTQAYVDRLVNNKEFHSPRLVIILGRSGIIHSFRKLALGL